MNRICPNFPVRLDPKLYERLREQVLQRDGWRCQAVGPDPTWKFTTKNFAVTAAVIQTKT